MKNDLQELRRSAVVSIFGPGSIIDFRAGGGIVSGIAAGLEEWDSSFSPPGLSNKFVTRETRLQKKLNVKGFRTPPVVLERGWNDEPDMHRLVAVRFPNWLQCPGCDLIKPEKRWMHDSGQAYRYCATCTGKSHGQGKVFVIPVRFVMACKDGHVDEFPWDWWVQHKPDCPLSNKEHNSSGHSGLFLRSERPGLAGLVLSCPKCGSRRSMDGVLSKKTWERGPKCRGRRPWIAGGDQKCDKSQQAVQRGASNLYFPVIESALSIPPWSDWLQEFLGTWWSSLINLEDLSKLDDYIEFMGKGDMESVLNELGMSPSQLANAIRERIATYDALNIADLKPAEYRQFVSEIGERRAPDNDFETRRENVPDTIAPWISCVVRAVRLREVRAIKGFTRINPPGDPEASEVARLSKKELDWLPAIDVHGEGIFLALEIERLKKWENRSDVKKRVSECERKYVEDWKERYGSDSEPPRTITPRYMLCHTLAHVLMRQLTLDCGYASASLQERIYSGNVDDQMAGLLIYTATPDADGTLGGLERQGKSSRIGTTLMRAIKAIEWCSSDPLCVTDMMGALNSFSHSVCHACCLAPETSCETFNRFLDRALLIGDGESPGLGYFEDMLGSD